MIINNDMQNVINEIINAIDRIDIVDDFNACDKLILIDVSTHIVKSNNDDNDDFDNAFINMKLSCM